jgi:hypothetical protein
MTASGTTGSPNLLPYPIDTDPVDVAGDIQLLATQTSGRLNIKIDNVLTTIGDILYASNNGTPYSSVARLAGNTTSSAYFLRSLGTGSSATVPTWQASTGTGNVVLGTSPTISNLTISGTLSTTGDVTVGGNLTVEGILTSINTNTLEVDDKNLELGSVTSVTVSATGTVGSITGSDPWTATITGMSDTSELIPGSQITAVSDTGSLGSGGTYVITTINSKTSVSFSATGGTTPTTGTITSIATTGATDTTANGGGITLKGTTNKTIIWDSTNNNWTSSENWNIPTGKTYKINNVTVLSSTTMLGITPTINTTGFTLSGGTTPVAVTFAGDSAYTISGTNGQTYTLPTAGGSLVANPMTTLGDIIYGGASGAPTRLIGNTTTTRKFFRQTGDGTNSTAPIWDTLLDIDIPSALTGKSYNGLTLTSTTGTFTLTNAKTFAVQNTMTLSSSADGNNLNIGTGGTLGSAAFTSSTEYISSTLMTAVGDIIIGGTAGAATRLAASTNGYILTLVGGSPAWAVAPAGYLAPTLGSTTIASGSTVTTIAGLTLTTPIIDTINASSTSATTSIHPTVTTGSITIGAGITTGTVNIATAGTSANSINIGNSNSTLVVNGTLTANSSVGTSGQVLKSTGTGITWANEPKLYSQETLPSSPNVGDTWYNTGTGSFYIYLNDGNSSQWVNPNANGSNDVILYNFSSFTFTTAGLVTGRLGPTYLQCTTAYSSTSWTQDLSYFNVITQGIQEWTVPKTGTYRITAAGGMGATVSTTSIGGAGAVISGTFSLRTSEKISILVGHSGVQTPLATSNKGGGGGSFVWKTGLGINGLLIAAGGGGGAQASFSGVAASLTTSGTLKSDGTGTPGTEGNGAINGGAGWLTNGTFSGTLVSAARTPLNGGVGGLGYLSNLTHEGAFGGGGGGGGSPATTEAAGGGGGYSGGAGGGTPGSVAGGGGGSFNIGLSPTASATNFAAGYVLIERLS